MVRRFSLALPGSTKTIFLLTEAKTDFFTTITLVFLAVYFFKEFALLLPEQELVKSHFQCAPCTSNTQK